MTHLLNTSTEQNMPSLYAFLNIRENMKNQEVGSLAVEHCTVIAAK